MAGDGYALLIFSVEHLGNGRSCPDVAVRFLNRQFPVSGNNFLEGDVGRVQAWQFGTRFGVTQSAVSEAAAAPLMEVDLKPAALRFLRGQIVGGGWRGGLLFGRALDGVLTVTMACYGGPVALDEPLGLDVSYALGVSDALEVVDPGADWVGCWITAPGRRTGSAVEDLQWWRWGLARGLVGDRVPLLSVGWSDGALHASAYVGDDVNPDRLPVTWGTV